jgi:hypothetical protein|tara:strand:+ start:164 stop:304 length:141 start_codon:yes stop_codon:yes gene_type:complete
MELFLVLKILLIIGLIVGLYAIARNLDILRIIFVYWIDSISSIFRK